MGTSQDCINTLTNIKNLLNSLVSRGGSDILRIVSSLGLLKLEMIKVDLVWQRYASNYRISVSIALLVAYNLLAIVFLWFTKYCVMWLSLSNQKPNKNRNHRLLKALSGFLNLTYSRILIVTPWELKQDYILRIAFHSS